MLVGKVGIVTGASRGIGAATARAFAEAGAKVVLAARDGHALESLSKSINALRPDSSVAVPTDVTDLDSVNNLVNKTIEAYGRLDLAFNNAGNGHVPAPLADLLIEDFDRAINTNVRGTFLSMKFEIPAMLRSGGGSIVNMSSTAGLQGVKGIGGYVTAKHGIIGLTRSAAMDYARQNIRVNVVAPGPIFSERLSNPKVREQAGFAVPMGRIGNREEVATVVSWLCSDLASFVTGTTVSIDGGRMSGVWFGSPTSP
jgi:NAD(P)-dependent dehydrogenase (short-subunit alcohol dehydrogenase family)